MNGIEEEPMAPQTFLYGCVLESGKEVVFNPENDDFEHQLDIRMACVDPSTKDEMHTVEVEGQDMEGQKIKAALVSLKPSTLPSVCLGGFTITPPAVFRLKAGSGPIHISGQHLVMLEAGHDFDEDDEDVEEEEEVQNSKKRPASSPGVKSQKKMKLEEAEEDDDYEEDDDDEDMDEEEYEESEEEGSPVKVTPVPSKPKVAAQNGKSPKATPAKKEVKTPKGKGQKSPKTQTPKALTCPEIKERIMEAMKKGVSLPKHQVKFENFVKNSYKVNDGKVITELWKWKETLNESK